MKHRGSVEAVESVVAPTGTYSTSLTISGVPVATGAGVVDHGALTGLSDDDHSQYSLVDGSRDFTANISTTAASPSAAAHLTRKDYVDGELTTLSSTLSLEIDGDIATHAADDDAHHAKYTDSEAMAATESARYTLSGTLSSEIDSDIAIHATDVDAHHSRYTDAEAISALEPTTSALAASGVATDANLVSVSGHLQSEIDGVPIPNFQQVYDASPLTPLQIDDPLKPLWIQTSDPSYLGLWMEGRSWIDSGTGEVLIQGADLTVESTDISMLSDNVVISGTQPTGSVYKLFAEDLTISGTHGLWVDANTTLSGSVNVQHVIPQADDTYDVGSEANHFRTIYLGNDGGEALVFESATSKGAGTNYTFNLGGGDDFSGYDNTFTFKMEDMHIASAGHNELVFDVGQTSIYGSNPSTVAFQSYMGVLGLMTLGIEFQSLFTTGNNVGFGLSNEGAGDFSYSLTFANNCNDNDFNHTTFSDKKIRFQFDRKDAMTLDVANTAPALLRVGVSDSTDTQAITSDKYGIVRIGAVSDAKYADNPLKMGNNNTTVASLYVREPDINLNGTTLTNAATVYIQDSPTEGSNNAGLWLTTNALFGNSQAAADGVRLNGTTSVGLGDWLGFSSTSTDANLLLYAYSDGSAQNVSLRLCNSGTLLDSGFLAASVVGSAASLTTGYLGSVAPHVTTLQIGEDNSDSSLTSINFTFNNTTSVAVSGTGLGTTGDFAADGAVAATSGSFAQSLTVSGVPVALAAGGGSFDELQGALIAQVFGV